MQAILYTGHALIDFTALCDTLGFTITSLHKTSQGYAVTYHAVLRSRKATGPRTREITDVQVARTQTQRKVG